METKNGIDLSGVVLYCQALDTIIELSNTTQEYFKQHAALIDYKLLMADSNLEDAFHELCSVNGSLLGMDVVKDIPDQYHKTRHALEEIMRNARTKQECFASYFKSTIEALGLAETRDKLNARLITIKSVDALLEDGISSSSPEGGSDPDWQIVKEHYKYAERYKPILALISALGKIVKAGNMISMYDYYFNAAEHKEFVKLLNKASSKICKAKSLLYRNDSDIKQLPTDLRYDTTLALIQLPDKIWQHLPDDEENMNLSALTKDINDLELDELRKKLKKFLKEKYIEEGENG